MSDFSLRGDIATTRAWLTANGFSEDVFINWNADALLGADKEDILLILPGIEGLRLWGLLNTARAMRGNYYSPFCCPNYYFSR